MAFHVAACVLLTFGISLVQKSDAVALSPFAGPHGHNRYLYNTQPKPDHGHHGPYPVSTATSSPILGKDYAGQTSANERSVQTYQHEPSVQTYGEDFGRNVQTTGDQSGRKISNTYSTNSRSGGDEVVYRTDDATNKQQNYQVQVQGTILQKPTARLFTDNDLTRDSNQLQQNNYYTQQQQQLQQQQQQQPFGDWAAWSAPAPSINYGQSSSGGAYPQQQQPSVPNNNYGTQPRSAQLKTPERAIQWSVPQQVFPPPHQARSLPLPLPPVHGDGQVQWPDFWRQVATGGFDYRQPQGPLVQTGWNAHGEQMTEYSDRAMLEETDSDVTGLTQLTHWNDTPRCSYVPFRKECQGHEWFRTPDGTCNNLQNPLLGSAFQPFQRYLPARYDDGASKARQTSSQRRDNGEFFPLPSPRLITRTVHLIKDAPSEFTGLLMQFGQFLDHDITGTSSVLGIKGAIICCGQNKVDHEECMPIPIPAGDTHFTNSTCLNFVRSLPVTDARNNTILPREQRNEVTSYLDASVVYGSTEDQTSRLRSFQWGLMKSSDGDMLPLETGGCAADDGLCLIGGDTRVNEVPGLSALHVVFYRHHNRLAEALRAQLLPNGAQFHPRVLDEALFQTARRILIAQWQHLVYTEWLPTILGPFTINHFGLGAEHPHLYDVQRDPRAANVFGAAAFRFGHSLVPAWLQYGDKRLMLHEVFNNPKWVRQGMDKIIKGVLGVAAQTRDQHFVEGLRNRLFESAPRKSLDLIALNIQRGRDHGLQPYNAWRDMCGLPPVTAFNSSEIGSCGPSLQEVYLSVEDVDVFTGAMCEPTLEGAVVGPTLACLIGRQFSDLKFGDRFFYQTSGKMEGFTHDQMRFIEPTTLAEILCANSHSLDTVQQNPFLPVSYKNSAVPCSQYRSSPASFRSLEPWRQELADLIRAIS